MEAIERGIYQPEALSPPQKKKLFFSIKNCHNIKKEKSKTHFFFFFLNFYTCQILK